MKTFTTETPKNIIPENVTAAALAPRPRELERLQCELWRHGTSTFPSVPWRRCVTPPRARDSAGLHERPVPLLEALLKCQCKIWFMYLYICRTAQPHSIEGEKTPREAATAGYIAPRSRNKVWDHLRAERQLSGGYPRNMSPGTALTTYVVHLLTF